MDKVQHLKAYGGLSPLPVISDSSIILPLPLGGGNSAPGVPDVSSSSKDKTAAHHSTQDRTVTMAE